MKKLVVTIVISAFAFTAFSQKLSKVTISNNGNNIMAAMLLEQNVVIAISQDGMIAEWGIDKYADRRADYIERVLEKFEGRVEYYKDNDNEAYRGKIKFIGSVQIKYYDSFEDEMLAGKIKSIGAVSFDYYNKYEDVTSKGKLKSIGAVTFAYYSPYENEAYRGKIKNAGNVAITYYSSLDDKAYAGKIKTMNGGTFTYYSSQDTNFPIGAMKAGRQIQYINGVSYIVRN